ncbi:MAG TPA: hypothetical protein VI387_10355 [Candidatus Brocadiales bacterium]|nr:hypothetical protein [Candidatus Brocadiales bacterium]
MSQESLTLSPKEPLNQTDTPEAAAAKSPQYTRVKGRLVSFLVGQTKSRHETAELVESKTLKSSPNYPDVLPKQRIIKMEKKFIDSKEVNFLVKLFLPNNIIIESSLEHDDILSDSVFELKKNLIAECKNILKEYHGKPVFDEEYTVYCISEYETDPEEIVSKHKDKIVGLLKTEKTPLDEEEIEATLKFNLKYSKDDLTVVEWDGAFCFDPRGDFDSNIELFEIANLQLLKLRMLYSELEDRLHKAAHMLEKTAKRSMLFRSKEIKNALREVVRMRTESILESEAIERNIRLIGDWYSARLYELTSKKFHLDTWKGNIARTLDTLEDLYSMFSDKFTVSFSVTLEFIIIIGWFLLLLGYFSLFFVEMWYR